MAEQSVDKTKELVREQFGTNAAKYVTSEVHAKGASLARLVELVQPQLDWHVLDVATAAGHTAFIFAPYVAHVTATDITPQMLKQAQKLAAERGIKNVSMQEADAEDLPFEDGSFHLVTCRIAPHHFPNIGRFVSECARVLRPGGVLAVVDNVSPENVDAAVGYNAFEKLRDPSHGRALRLAEWLDHFAETGFTVVAQETADKRMAFNWWAERMNVTPLDKETLRGMLLNAPDALRDFLRPQQIDDDIAFYLTEAIIIGKLGT